MKTIVMLNSMSFLPHQGRYLRIYNEAKTLADAGYDVTLIAWDRDGTCPRRETIDGIKLERLVLKAQFAKGPINAFKHALFNLILLGKLLTRSYDIVHCFNLDTLLPGLIAAKLRGKKITLDLCEPNYYMYWSDRFLSLAQLIGTMEKHLSPFLDYVFVHNLYQMRKFRSFGIDRLVQIASVPGTDMMVDAPKGSTRKSKKKQREVVIGRIGTVYPHAGIEETIEAFKMLVARGNPVKLLFAGLIFENYEDPLRKLIEPVKDHVELMGKFDISEMPALYKKIDLSIQVHKKTPWFQNITPTKFFESLANAVPVVASDVGDYKELMASHPCGIIVDENDPENICNEIEKLIRDPDLLQKMSRTGLELVKNEYCWPVMAERILKAYTTL